LNFNEGQITKFLYATQGVGAIFIGVFLAAYLSGLPTTAVLHSDPIVRASLSVIGIVFLLLILSTVILIAIYKKNRSL